MDELHVRWCDWCWPALSIPSHTHHSSTRQYLIVLVLVTAMQFISAIASLAVAAKSAPKQLTPEQQWLCAPTITYHVTGAGARWTMRPKVPFKT